MTEKLNEEERGWLSYRLPAALRIIDEQAAELTTESRVRLRLMNELDTTRAQLAKARARIKHLETAARRLLVTWSGVDGGDSDEEINEAFDALGEAL